MKRKHTLVTLGITSLFLIFSILCLVILSLLTFSSSRSDLQMSRRAMEQTTAYYAASSQACDICRSVDTYLEDAYRKAPGIEEYRAALPRITDLDGRITWEEEEELIRFVVPISDTQDLQVTAKALYPEEDGEPYLEILSRKSIASGEWTPDKKQPVYKGVKQ